MCVGLSAIFLFAQLRTILPAELNFLVGSLSSGGESPEPLKRGRPSSDGDCHFAEVRPSQSNIGWAIEDHFLPEAVPDFWSSSVSTRTIEVVRICILVLEASSILMVVYSDSARELTTDPNMPPAVTTRSFFFRLASFCLLYTSPSPRD